MLFFLLQSPGSQRLTLKTFRNHHVKCTFRIVHGNVYLGYSPEFYLPVHSKGKFCTQGLNRNVQLSMGSYEVKRLKTIHITLSLIICFIVSGQLCSARQKIMFLLLFSAELKPRGYYLEHVF